MPSWFNFPRGADFWLPLELSPAEEQERVRSTLSALGRLRQGTNVRDAQAELDRYADILARRHPTTNAGRRLAILPLREEQYQVHAAFLLDAGDRGAVRSPGGGHQRRQHLSHGAVDAPSRTGDATHSWCHARPIDPGLCYGRNAARRTRDRPRHSLLVVCAASDS